MSLSKIQWTDRTWNPVRGCSRVSEGCRNCYAERFAARFSGTGICLDNEDAVFHGFAAMTTNGPRWTGKVALIPDKLSEPLRWHKPARIFVNSMSDLFHEKLSGADINRVFAVMAVADRHTFQVLTKRPERMKAVVEKWYRQTVPYPVVAPNVWLGVSVEDQATADERIPLLLQTPAAVRFVSYEPAIAGVDFYAHLRHQEPFCSRGECEKAPGLDWLIVGGESGPGARPCDVAWIRSAVRQCREAGVACFVKQLGSIPYEISHTEKPKTIWMGRIKRPTRRRDGWRIELGPKDRKGGDPSEWPEDLRVREFPSTVNREGN